MQFEERPSTHRAEVAMDRLSSESSRTPPAQNQKEKSWVEEAEKTPQLFNHPQSNDRSEPLTPPVSPSPPASASGSFEAFEDWISDYLTVSHPEQREAMEKTGKQLAAQRRQALRQLIQADPEQSFRWVVPQARRRLLPGPVQEQMESYIRGQADFMVMAQTAIEDNQEPIPRIQRFATLQGRQYQAFVYNRRLKQTTQRNLPIHGIAIDNLLAIHEDPLQVLEEDEILDLSQPASNEDGLCPVSDSPADQEVGVAVGQKVYYLCSASHAQAFNRILIDQEESLSQAGQNPAEFSRTRGHKTVLFMRIIFPDHLAASISEEEAYQLMDQVNTYFEKTSYGAISFTATVTPPLLMPFSRDTYHQSELGLLRDARQEAAAQGYDPALYDLDILHGNSPYLWNQAVVGGKGVWLTSNQPGTACHELGHNLGLFHANAWITSNQSTIGPGRNAEYGNPFDTMGSGMSDNYSFNAFEKYKLYWLPSGAVHQATSNGIYRLHPVDHFALEDGHCYSLRISKDSQRDYWIETRQENKRESHLPQGVFLIWSPWSKSNGGSQLLNACPSVSGQFALPLGQSFYDLDIGLKITPLPFLSHTPEAIDVMVNRVFYIPVEPTGGWPAGLVSRDADPGGEQNSGISTARSETNTYSAPGNGRTRNGEQAMVKTTSSPQPSPPRGGEGEGIWGVQEFDGPSVLRDYFQVTIPETDSYVIWAFAARQDPAVDSEASFITDEQGLRGVIDHSRITDSGSWVLAETPKSRLIETAVGQLYQLAQGTHVLRVDPGDSRIAIKRLLVTNDRATNPPPILSRVDDQSMLAGSLLAVPLPLVSMGQPVFSLTIRATSENLLLVPDANLNIHLEGTQPILTIQSQSNQSGTVQITLSVTDSAGRLASQNFSLSIVGPIQSLINAAMPGGQIILPPGVHQDNVIIDRDLVLISQGPDPTILNGTDKTLTLIIRTNCSVVCKNLVISNGRGASIRNFGSLTLESCEITHHPPHEGIGIDNRGSLVMKNSKIHGHHGTRGGGLENYAIAVLDHCAVTDNQAGTRAGGILNRKAARLECIGSYIANNRALGGHGGGILNEGEALLVNCTIYNNTTTTMTGGEPGRDHLTGGGIHNIGEISMRHVTINSNQSDWEGGGINNQGNATLVNTLIAGNQSVRTELVDCYGTFTSEGHNLVQSVGGYNLLGNLKGNLLGFAPHIGPPTTCGGLTYILPLQTGSPAIDAGDGSLSPAFDQCGMPRPAGPGSDIGAAEYQRHHSVTVGSTGVVQLLLDLPPQSVCQIEASTDLVQWTVIGQGVTDANGRLEFVETPARDGHLARFYRAIYSNLHQSPP